MDYSTDKDRLLISAIEQHEANSETYGNLQEDRTQALDYYLGKPLGNEVEGRSQVINRTVWDTVEWLKPQLADIFCSGEEIVSFTPRSPDDVQAAEQEADYVNYVITQRNPWFEIFYGWSHDALIQKNGYVKVFWDDATDETVERYENLTNDEFALLMQDKDVQVIEHEERAVSYDPMGAYVEVTHTVKVQRTKPRNVVRIENVAPEHVRVSQNASTVSLQDPRIDFVQHAEHKTISELREEGFDVPDDISDSGDGVGDWEEDLRDDYTPFRDRDGESADPSMRRVKVRETWIRFDKNEDGKAELLHCILVGTTMLHCEETDHVPLVALCPTPLAHRHYGLSVADAVMDLQRIQTALLRGALDNQYLANNGRYGINQNTVNLDDMLDSRAGGVVRVDGEPGSSIFPLTHPTNGQIAIPMLEYVEKIAQRRTGVNEQTQGLDPNSLNKTATGAQLLMSAAQQRIKFIARIFAETGIKALFQLVHQLTLQHSRQMEMIQLRGNWVPVDPRTWVKRQDVQISMTLGTGDKPQQLAMLQQIGMAQREALAIGAAKPKNIYNTLSRMAKLMGFKDSTEFFTDPGDGPMQPPQDPKLAIAQMQAQSDVQRFQAEAMLKQQVAEIEANAKQRETELQLQLQAANDARDSEREQLKAQLNAEIENIRVQAQREIAAMKDATDRYVAELQSQTSITIEQMRLGQRAQEVQAQSMQPQGS